MIGGYQKLSSVQQSIVQLFSVIDTPVSRATLFDCLQHEALEDEPIRSLTFAKLNGHLDAFLAMDLLVQQPGKGPQCHSLLAELATRDAVKAERFSKMAIAVYAILPTPRRRGKSSPRYRTKAAMSFKGGFKLLTTGTLLENYLGELWNLFRFINPGLLGSINRFNQQLAYPIERGDNQQARTRRYPTWAIALPIGYISKGDRPKHHHHHVHA